MFILVPFLNMPNKKEKSGDLFENIFAYYVLKSDVPPSNNVSLDFLKYIGNEKTTLNDCKIPFSYLKIYIFKWI